MVSAEHPWDGAAARGRRGAAPRAARARRRDHRRAEPRRSRLRAAARGAVRAGAAGRGRGGAGALRFVRRSSADRDAGREIYVNLGRGEMRAGRSLDALLAAYRLGARVAWRRLAAAGERPARARDPVPARGGDLRLHRRALRRVGRGLRARAVRGGGRAPAPAPAAGRAAGAGPAGGARAVEAAAARPAGGCRGASPAAWSADESSEAPPARAPARSGCDRGTRSPPLLVPDPERPRDGASSSAALREHRAALGPTVPWRRLRAPSRAPARRCGSPARAASRATAARSWPSDHAGAAARTRTARLAREWPRPRWPRSTARPASRERLGCDAPGLAPPPGRQSPWRRPSTSIRRPCATASARLRELFGDAARRPGRALRARVGAARAAHSGVAPSPRMAGPLDGRVAVVTGASSGIGEATALALSPGGRSVALGARARTASTRSPSASRGGPTFARAGRRLRRGPGARLRRTRHGRARRPGRPRQQRRVMLLGPVAGADTETGGG